MKIKQSMQFYILLVFQHVSFKCLTLHAMHDVISQSVGFSHLINTFNILSYRM